MDLGASFAKYVLFLFNILVLVCGILAIVFGSISIANTGGIRNLGETFSILSIPIFIVVIGCITTIISFVGCCGAIRENTCLTMTYSAVMLFLFVLQMVMVFYIWFEQDSFLKVMNTIVDTAWKKRNEKINYMDVIQMDFNCCGRFGVQDYLTEEVPKSCCGSLATTCSYELAKPKLGCTNALKTFWLSHIATAKYAGLVVAGIELISFIFACCIANQARNERRRAGYY